MAKYQTNNLKRYQEAKGDEFWAGATGGDVLKDVVNNPGDRMGKLKIEEQFANLVKAVGLIADKTGINLLDVFGRELQLQYRLNPED